MPPLRKLRNAPWRTREYRIGLIGQFAAGKSVLLTSLINHLEFHRPGRFSLNHADPQPELYRFQAHGSGNGWKQRRGWEYFNYLRCRDGLVKGRFPDKTGMPEEFVCTFRRSDRWPVIQYRLRFFDIPGERLADASIAEKTFSNWSQQMLFQLQSDDRFRHCSKEFCDLVDSTEPLDEQRLITEYKRTLARLISQYRPYITPSTFLLDPQGEQAEPGTPEEMAACRVSGLEGAEFVPLSLKAQQANPDLARTFRNRYQRYRKEIVLPIFRALGHCDSLIVLVDVLTILAGNPGMLDDNNGMLEDLLTAIGADGGLLNRLQKLAAAPLPARWRPGGVERVAFVAPMADRVGRQEDRDSMRNLLEERRSDHLFSTSCGTRSCNPQPTAGSVFP